MTENDRPRQEKRVDDQHQDTHLESFFEVLNFLWFSSGMFSAAEGPDLSLLGRVPPAWVSIILSSVPCT